MSKVSKASARRAKRKIKDVRNNIRAGEAGICEFFGHDSLGGRFERDELDYHFSSGQWFDQDFNDQTVVDMFNMGGNGRAIDCVFDRSSTDVWGESVGDVMKDKNHKHYSHAEQLEKTHEEWKEEGRVNVKHWDIWSL